MYLIMWGSYNWPAAVVAMVERGGDTDVRGSGHDSGGGSGGQW